MKSEEDQPLRTEELPLGQQHGSDFQEHLLWSRGLDYQVGEVWRVNRSWGSRGWACRPLGEEVQTGGAVAERKETKSLKEEEICMSNKYTKSYPTLLVIREMQIKTQDISIHSIRKMFKSDNTKCGGRCGPTQALTPASGVVNQHNHSGNQWHHLMKLNMHIPCAQRSTPCSHVTDTTRMFIAAVFTVAKT